MTTHQDVLRLLAERPLSVTDIETAFVISHDAAKWHSRKLKQEGYATARAGQLHITEAGTRALAVGFSSNYGPRKGAAQSRQRPTLRAKAWRAMRIRDGFSLDDLLTMLCDGTERYAATNLADYIRALVGAGYLLPMPRRGNGPHPQRYRLRRERNTGPEAPAWNKQTRILVDHNTGETIVVPPVSKQEAPHA